MTIRDGVRVLPASPPRGTSQPEPKRKARRGLNRCRQAEVVTPGRALHVAFPIVQFPRSTGCWWHRWSRKQRDCNHTAEESKGKPTVPHQKPCWQLRNDSLTGKLGCVHAARPSLARGRRPKPTPYPALPSSSGSLASMAKEKPCEEQGFAGLL